MSSSNAIYLEYNSIITTQEEKSKDIRKKISEYTSKAEAGENTVDIEIEIEKDLSSLKESHRELDNAYSYKNAPSQISPNELDRRQKQIQRLGIGIQDLQKDFKKVKDKKYEFKGPTMENYQPTDDMKTMSNSELYQFQVQKIKQQDDQIDEIFMDAVKGKALAKEAGKIMDEQNKQLDELQEDIDRLDSRLKRGTKRFADYAARQSGCCIVIILILELIAGILFVTLI